MQCECCGERTRVVRTVQVRPGVTERTRACDGCGRVFTTVERRGRDAACGGR
ncbi:hypothetical protein [Desulfocurvus sp. DL9XJH121]